MSITKGAVHGVASMIVVIVGAVITTTIKENIEVFAFLSDTTVWLLINIGNVPVSEEVAAIVLPVGILMGLWVFTYEVKQMTN